MRTPHLEAIVAQWESIDSLLQKADENPDAMTADDRETLASFRDGLVTEIEIKADALAESIEDLESYAEAKDARAEGLREEAHKLRQRAARRRSVIEQCMATIGRNEINGQAFRLKMAKPGGKAPIRLLVFEPEQLPGRFQRVKTIVEADKEKLREAIFANDPHVKQYAELEDRPARLVIK